MPHSVTTATADVGALANPFAGENAPKEPALYRQTSVDDPEVLLFHSEGNTQTGSRLRESQQGAADKRLLQQRARDLVAQQARV